jgi:hypothetical protein
MAHSATGASQAKQGHHSEPLLLGVSGPVLRRNFAPDLKTKAKPV